MKQLALRGFIISICGITSACSNSENENRNSYLANDNTGINNNVSDNINNNMTDIAQSACEFYCYEHLVCELDIHDNNTTCTYDKTSTRISKKICVVNCDSFLKTLSHIKLRTFRDCIKCRQDKIPKTCRSYTDLLYAFPCNDCNVEDNPTLWSDFNTQVVEPFQSDIGLECM